MKGNRGRGVCANGDGMNGNYWANVITPRQVIKGSLERVGKVGMEKAGCSEGAAGSRWRT